MAALFRKEVSAVQVHSRPSTVAQRFNHFPIFGDSWNIRYLCGIRADVAPLSSADYLKVTQVTTLLYFPVSIYLTLFQ